jgi:NDP-sugar pyrophosphorylase family protein
VTTSGVGSRLGSLTDHTNKCLVSIGRKNSLAYIIESYPPEVVFVVTLGHFGEHVREFLQISYPERFFEFVEVNNFKGPGSSLAFSMLAAKTYLQEPFIFHASDTIVHSEDIPTPTYNWIFGNKSVDADNYATFDVEELQVLSIHEKGMTEFDFIHIGLVGIFNFVEFWSSLEEVYKDSSISNPTDVNVIRSLIKKGIKFNSIETKNWVDIGNSSALLKAKEKLDKSFITLPKVDESIVFIGNSVVKFFADPKINENRINRAQVLSGLVPDLEDSSKHFFKYKYIQGEVLSKVGNAHLISKLLDWAQEKLWTPKKKFDILDFQKKCEEFYLEKTIRRLTLLISSRGVTDKATIINGYEIPPAFELINEARNHLLQNIVETGFHGDFILDNIIFQDNAFKLIDWRQDFSGDLEFGDKYYDLAKLNHSLFINHDIVNSKLFEISTNKHEVICTILRKDTHVEMQTLLGKFILEQSLSKQKVDILTAIIWLNMSPLHHHPFDLFLYNYGKLNLWKALNSEQ